MLYHVIKEKEGFALANINQGSLEYSEDRTVHVLGVSSERDEKISSMHSSIPYSYPNNFSLFKLLRFCHLSAIFIQVLSLLQSRVDAMSVQEPAW